MNPMLYKIKDLTVIMRDFIMDSINNFIYWIFTT